MAPSLLPRICAKSLELFAPCFIRVAPFPAVSLAAPQKIQQPAVIQQVSLNGSDASSPLCGWWWHHGASHGASHGLAEITFLTFIVAPLVAWNVMLVGACFYGLGSGSYMSRSVLAEERTVPNKREVSLSQSLSFIVNEVLC